MEVSLDPVTAVANVESAKKQRMLSQQPRSHYMLLVSRRLFLCAGVTCCRPLVFGYGRRITTAALGVLRFRPEMRAFLRGAEWLTIPQPREAGQNACRRGS